MIRVFQSVVLALFAANMCYCFIFKMPQEIIEKTTEKSPKIKGAVINEDNYPYGFIQKIVDGLSPKELEIVNGDKTRDKLDDRTGNRSNCTSTSGEYPVRIYWAEDESGNIYTVISDKLEGGVILEYCNAGACGDCDKPRRAAAPSCCVPHKEYYKLLVLEQENLEMRNILGESIPYYPDYLKKNTPYTESRKVEMNLLVANTACICRSQAMRSYGKECI